MSFLVRRIFFIIILEKQTQHDANTAVLRRVCILQTIPTKQKITTIYLRIILYVLSQSRTEGIVTLSTKENSMKMRH